MLIAPEVIHKQQSLLKVDDIPATHVEKRDPPVSVGAQVLICYLGLLLASGVFYMIYLRCVSSQPEQDKLIKPHQLQGPSENVS